jgi:hypothetical protein
LWAIPVKVFSLVTVASGIMLGFATESIVVNSGITSCGDSVVSGVRVVGIKPKI